MQKQHLLAIKTSSPRCIKSWTLSCKSEPVTQARKKSTGKVIIPIFLNCRITSTKLWPYDVLEKINLFAFLMLRFATPNKCCKRLAWISGYSAVVGRKKHLLKIIAERISSRLASIFLGSYVYHAWRYIFTVSACFFLGNEMHQFCCTSSLLSRCSILFTVKELKAWGVARTPVFQLVHRRIHIELSCLAQRLWESTMPKRLLLLLQRIRIYRWVVTRVQHWCQTKSHTWTKTLVLVF